MNINYKETLIHVINYIEDHIKEDITLDKIATISYLSKFHLHRIFKAITSKSLIEYVRERKLSCSAFDILNTDLSICQIALDYSYNQEQSYNRAFKKHFNINPAKYRKEKCELIITNKIDVDSIYTLGDGFLINPVFFLKPKFHIVGIQHKISFTENLDKALVTTAAIDFIENGIPTIPNVKNPKLFIGFDRYSHNRDNYLDYITATEVSSIENVPNSMVSCTIPTTHFACFKYIGFHPDTEITAIKLKKLYHYIFSHWFPTSTLKQSDPFHFERLNCSLSTPSYCEMELFFPINPKSSTK